MDFELSPEQEQLRESVRRFLAERAPIAWVRERWASDEATTHEPGPWVIVAKVAESAPTHKRFISDVAAIDLERQLMDPPGS